VARAVAAGIPVAEAAVVVDVAAAAATGDIDDCRLTIFELKSSVAVGAFIENRGRTLKTSIGNRKSQIVNHSEPTKRR
jgi:hypothetical protein